ncbi:MAG: hypothetical protein ACLP7P_05425 [Rhodomicrobium sp.]
MSISDPQEFAEWLASMRKNLAGFTLLVILTEIREKWVHVVQSVSVGIAASFLAMDESCERPLLQFSTAS